MLALFPSLSPSARARAVVFTMLGAVSLTVAACTGDDDDVTGGTIPNDTAGLCAGVTCTVDADCNVGDVCNASGCCEAGGSSGGPIFCSSSAECPTDQDCVCFEEDGCAKDQCATRCDSDFDCEALEICTKDKQSGQGHCQPVECTEDAQCDDRGAGFICQKNACVGQCGNLQQCPSGTVLSLATCQCVVPPKCELSVTPTTGVQDFGAVAFGDSVCKTIRLSVEGECKEDEATGTPGGVTVKSVAFDSSTDLDAWSFPVDPPKDYFVSKATPISFDFCFTNAKVFDDTPNATVNLITNDAFNPLVQVAGVVTGKGNPNLEIFEANATSTPIVDAQGALKELTYDFGENGVPANVKWQFILRNTDNPTESTKALQIEKFEITSQAPYTVTTGKRLPVFLKAGEELPVTVSFVPVERSPNCVKQEATARLTVNGDNSLYNDNTTTVGASDIDIRVAGRAGCRPCVLEVNPNPLTFGEVQICDTPAPVTKKIIVKNNGENECSVSPGLGVADPNGLLQAGTKFSVPPNLFPTKVLGNSSIEIPVTYNPTDVSDAGNNTLLLSAPEDITLPNGNLSIGINAKPVDPNFVVDGIDTASRTLDFGQVDYTLGSIDREIVLRNFTFSGTLEVAQFQLLGSSQFSLIDGNGNLLPENKFTGSLAPNENRTFTVRFTPQAPPAGSQVGTEQTATLLVQSNDCDFQVPGFPSGSVQYTIKGTSAQLFGRDQISMRLSFTAEGEQSSQLTVNMPDPTASGSIDCPPNRSNAAYTCNNQTSFGTSSTQIQFKKADTTGDGTYEVAATYVNDCAGCNFLGAFISCGTLILCSDGTEDEDFTLDISVRDPVSGTSQTKQCSKRFTSKNQTQVMAELTRFQGRITDISCK
jgi:hypothetical protein